MTLPALVRNIKKAHTPGPGPGPEVHEVQFIFDVKGWLETIH